MPVDFFEKELGKIQARFNQTFGIMPLCNPKARIRAIFAIVQMCILQKKIMKEKQKEDISRFVKTKDRLNKIFSTLIKETERRQHDKNKSPKVNESGNGRSTDMHLPEMQNSLSDQAFKTG